LRLEAGTGSGIVAYLTHGLEILNKWLASTAGTNAAHSLFEAHKQQILDIMNAFGTLLATVGPSVIKILTTITQNSASTFPALANILSPMLTILLQIIDALLKIPGVGPLLGVTAALAGLSHLNLFGVGAAMKLITGPLDWILLNGVGAAANLLGIGGALGKLGEATAGLSGLGQLGLIVGLTGIGAAAGAIAGGAAGGGGVGQAIGGVGGGLTGLGLGLTAVAPEVGVPVLVTGLAISAANVLANVLTSGAAPARAPAWALQAGTGPAPGQPPWSQVGRGEQQIVPIGPRMGAIPTAAGTGEIPVPIAPPSLSNWQTFLNFMRNTMPQTILNSLHTIAGDFTGFGGQVGRALSTVTGTVGSWLANFPRWGRDAMAGLKSGLDTGFTAVANFFTGLPGRIEGYFSAAKTWLITHGHNIVSGMEDGMHTAFTTVAGWVAGWPGVIGGWLHGAVSWLVGGGEQLIKGLWNGAVITFNLVAGWVAGWPGVVGGWLHGAINWLEGAGEQIMNGLWNGMKTVWERVKGWLSNLNPANWKGPAERDLAMLHESGQLIMQGLQNGMQEGWNKTSGWLGTVKPTISGLGGRGGGGAVTYAPSYSVTVGSVQDAAAFRAMLQQHDMEFVQTFKQLTGT
jgi:hypothetical protein